MTEPSDTLDTLAPATVAEVTATPVIESEKKEVGASATKTTRVQNTRKQQQSDKKKSEESAEAESCEDQLSDKDEEDSAEGSEFEANSDDSDVKGKKKRNSKKTAQSKKKPIAKGKKAGKKSANKEDNEEVEESGNGKEDEEYNSISKIVTKTPPKQRGRPRKDLSKAVISEEKPPIKQEKSAVEPEPANDLPTAVAESVVKQTNGASDTQSNLPKKRGRKPAVKTTPLPEEAEVAVAATVTEAADKVIDEEETSNITPAKRVTRTSSGRLPSQLEVYQPTFKKYKIPAKKPTSTETVEEEKVVKEMSLEEEQAASQKKAEDNTAVKEVAEDKEEKSEESNGIAKKNVEVKGVTEKEKSEDVNGKAEKLITSPTLPKSEALINGKRSSGDVSSNENLAAAGEAEDKSVKKLKKSEDEVIAE